MVGTDSTVPRDWFERADNDITAAEILIAQHGPDPIIAFHLQQAAEKYLKGYLLSTGWRLRRIHDLGVLVKEAVERDADFASFVAPCQRITEYYVEMRYPTGAPTAMRRESLATDVEVVRSLAALARGKVK